VMPMIRHRLGVYSGSSMTSSLQVATGVDCN
jgi:hypothetical protein